MTLADPLAMTTAYQDSALVAAAVETGVVEAIANAPVAAEQVARRCETDPRATLALLRALTSQGLVESCEQGFVLSDAAAILARSHPESISEIVAKEWFFYRAWAGLAETIRDGHARIGTWRDRLRDEPATAHAFLRALDDLASRFGGELPGLADLSGSARLLDVGGGAGSHSAALVAATPGLQATVLDLPDCEVVLRERHPELPFLAGDLDTPRFGRPQDEEWDVVLLANILHDHPPERCERYLAEAAALLRPGGTLLIYDWLIGPDDPQPPQLAMFSLMMMVENEGGGTWTEAQVSSWLARAGLAAPEFRRGQGPISVIRARRPVGDGEPTMPDASAAGPEKE